MWVARGGYSRGECKRLSVQKTFITDTTVSVPHPNFIAVDVFETDISHRHLVQAPKQPVPSFPVFLFSLFHVSSLNLPEGQ